MTRRGILSVVSAMFDPLGLIAPATLRAKAIIQTLCRDKMGWDEPIPRQQELEWKAWLSSLSDIENVSVRLCYKTHRSGNKWKYC